MLPKNFLSSGADQQQWWGAEVAEAVCLYYDYALGDALHILGTSCAECTIWIPTPETWLEEWAHKQPPE